MSVKVLDASMEIVLTLSTCTPVIVNLALQVPTVIQVCLILVHVIYNYLLHRFLFKYVLLIRPW